MQKTAVKGAISASDKNRIIVSECAHPLNSFMIFVTSLSFWAGHNFLGLCCDHLKKTSIVSSTGKHFK